METLEKKGKGSALLPFLLFIVIYLGAGLYFQAQGVEMAFYQFPSVTAMFIALLLAFCLIPFASTYFFLGALALFLPVIWCMPFSTAMRSGASWPPAPRRRTPSSSACPIWTANGWESCCASVTVSSAGRWW